METAFRNQLVLQHIFSYLPLRDLKQCRFVSKDWNLEIQSYVRTFRHCDAKISGKNPCSDLSVLDGIASQTTALTINSLTIEFSSLRHSNCESLHKETRAYDELSKKLLLRYLCIRWCGRLKPKECPATKFVVDLLQEKMSNLHTLSLGGVPRKVRNRYFGPDWTPRSLPQLKVLQVEGIRSWKGMFLKILNAAPNLQKLIVDEDMAVLDIVPNEKYSLLDNCYLCMDSSEQQLNCMDFALSLPTLSNLVTSAPPQSDRQYHRSYFRALEALLHTSCKTLKALKIEDVIFPFNQLRFPALLNLKELTIYTQATTEQILQALRSIDFPTLLPVLEKVEVTVHNEGDEEEELYVSPCGSNATAPAHSWPSTTVKKLALEFDVNRESLEACGRIFTNVRHLTLLQMAVELEHTPYEVLWAYWSQVEFMEITESDIELGENFDAQFLGINPEEASLLRQLDDESLEMMNIVPIRPSILTMPRLKTLKIVFNAVYISDEGYPNPDQVFLSKLTGILAFKKLQRMRVTIEIHDAKNVISYLNHLRTFVNFVN